MVDYGNTMCRNCNAVHPPHEWVTESLQTKSQAKEIVFLLSQVFLNQGGGRQLPAGGPITNAEASRPLIIGVLIHAGVTYVANSGGPSQAFNEVVRRIRLSKPALVRVQAAGANPTTRGGTAIGAAALAACQAPGGNMPLSCAAPKLIDAAIRAGGAGAYAMSEVWFDARRFNQKITVTTARPEAMGAGIFTDHGQSRLSCATCQNVVPMQLCVH